MGVTDASGRGFRRRRRAGRRHVGIEIERAQLDMRHDRQRHGESHDDAARALEFVELEDGIAHLDVAAARPHAALDAELRELARRYRRDIDREPRQGLPQLWPDQAEVTGYGGARRISRQGRPCLHGEVARQRGRKLRHGDGAAPRFEFEGHVADGLLVVDHLADLERELGVEGRQPTGRRLRGRGGRSNRGRRRGGRRRPAAPPLVGKRDRRQPAVEIEPGGREPGLDGERGRQGERERARTAVLAQHQLEVLGRHRLRREIDGTVEPELAGQQRRQARSAAGRRSRSASRRRPRGCPPTPKPCPTAAPRGRARSTCPCRRACRRPPPARRRRRGRWRSWHSPPDRSSGARR